MKLADSLFPDRKLVKETEWTRVYSTGPNSYYYESKFLYDNLNVSAPDIQSRWPNFSRKEKIDFANSFSAKSPLTPEDEEILEFLMGPDGEEVWPAIATRLPNMTASRHEKVLDFLLCRVEQNNNSRANYYQALALLKDAKAVPYLKKVLVRERQQLDLTKPLESFEDIFPYLEYLGCCAALYHLTGELEYKELIDEMASHPDEKVKVQARLALRP